MISAQQPHCTAMATRVGEEAGAVHVSEPESNELLDIARGVEQDEDFYDGCESE